MCGIRIVQDSNSGCLKQPSFAARKRGLTIAVDLIEMAQDFLDGDGRDSHIMATGNRRLDIIPTQATKGLSVVLRRRQMAHQCPRARFPPSRLPKYEPYDLRL